ncbi:nuclear transport factor 2 family protein [Nocardioides campestrisoli]|uniref:nuclear transport factor 2 family protein n=1 Tax=Nocardioides campestrisoli TaxID=2736757 RepID=UPI00163D549A|nr:nuclear transport factor 2 family protein [Nocardioides campestrisoli]
MTTPEQAPGDLDLAVAVQTLLARQQVTDTLHEYSRHVDTCDVDALVGIFTEDAVFDYGHGRVFTGRKTLDGLFREVLAKYAATNHHCSTTTFLALDAETAETITYVYAFHDSGPGGQHVHVWGRYEDRLVREADRWRIAQRRVRVAGVETGDSQPVPERFERYQRAVL